MDSDLISLLSLLDQSAASYAMNHTILMGYLDQLCWNLPVLCISVWETKINKKLM